MTERNDRPVEQDKTGGLRERLDAGYRALSSRLLDVGANGLSRARSLTGILPGAGKALDKRLSEARQWLDEMNRSLAEQAVPPERRDNVTRLRREPGRQWRVVEGGRGREGAKSPPDGES